MANGFLGAFTKLQKATLSFVTSDRLSSWNRLAPIGRALIKFDILTIFRKSVQKLQVPLKSDTTTSTLPENEKYFTQTL
jgi:hypothetical protein